MKCSDYLTSCNNQLGFKYAHSTDLCVYTLKEYIEYYKNRETTVYVTFLDASKAFDRFNYWLLFDKLVKKHVPLFIIKLLCYWCTIKKMLVRLGASASTQFTAANGVKQRGIILLFYLMFTWMIPIIIMYHCIIVSLLKSSNTCTCA